MTGCKAVKFPDQVPHFQWGEKSHDLYRNIGVVVQNLANLA